MGNSLEVLKHRPHVVILGAGASVATIPHGDKYGRKISVMDGFIDTLGMRHILKGIKFKSENLEDIYSELSRHQEYDEIRRKLEDTIREYFSRFRLPDEPTIYDLLLLSLKEKDVVATFNWDPLIIHAIQRVSIITKKIPSVLFLHGNVAIQICQKDGIAFFVPHIDTEVCRECGQILSHCKLLYPVRQKNYSDDSYIKNQWDCIRYYLSQAYIVTFFGYSAPSTDVEAIKLLREAWGKSESRKMEEIEIIDIKDEVELENTWKPFVYSHHRRIHSSFYDSLAAQSPRRSTEDLYACLMDVQWLDYPNRLYPGMTWDQIKQHFAPILEEEQTSCDGGER